MSKVCVYCKQDCSNKPRLKDADGHYACKECAQKHAGSASRSGSRHHAAPAPRPETQAPARPHTPRAPSHEAPAPDEGEIDLSAVVAASEHVDVQLRAMRVCPACQTSNLPAAQDCRECGFNFATGRAAPTPEERAARASAKLVGIPAKAACEKCNYSLKGLRTPVCPECGHINPTDAAKVDHQQRSLESAKNYWKKPLIMIAASLPIAAGFHAYSVVHAGGSIMKGLFVFALMQAVYVTCSFVVYFMLCLMFFGFSQSLRLAALCLVAVATTTSAISVVLSVIIPLPLIPGLITTFCYCGIAADLLDMELKDAFFFGILCSVATWFGGAALVLAVLAALGM